uniref:Dynactin domain-containing protein n=1 Tax=Steinernema glaseri TaxID=37863 RepID=A0A1I7ZS95_9BILA
MAQPELVELETTIEELKQRNYALEVQLRIVRGQLPRVQNLNEAKLQDEVLRLGDDVAQLQNERVRFATDLEEANKLAERLMAEKNTMKKDYDTSLEELKDKVVKITRESNENYRLYMDQKQLVALMKADMERVGVVGRPSMDMSTATSDGNMSIMSERDKELMRLTSTVFQTKMEAEKRSRELQQELEKAKEQIGKRDDMIRQLITKNSGAEKKVKEVENLLEQERSMYRTYLDKTEAAVRNREQEDCSKVEEGGDQLGLQSRIEDVAERHLHLQADRSLSDSVAQIYMSQVDLPNASARPDDSVMSTTYNNMSLSFAFNQAAISGSGDIDQLAAIANTLFKKLRATAGTLRTILGGGNPHVVELEASIRELEASIQTSFVEGVGSVKKELDRMQTLLSKKDGEIDELKEKLEDAEKAALMAPDEKELDSMKALLSEKDDEIDELKKKLEDALEVAPDVNELDRMQALVSKKDEEIDELKEKLDDALMALDENELDRIQSLLSKKDEEIDELKRKLEDVEKDVLTALEENESDRGHSIGWNVSKCIERLERVDASANNIVQLLKGVGTLPVLPHTLDTMMTFARQARDDAYKCVKFLRTVDKENQTQNSMMIGFDLRLRRYSLLEPVAQFPDLD